jgi:pimeloyl-ACP methyl ester carboxylesterase
MNRDASGAPAATGVHDVPFRVAIPTGTGDYRIVMYGHGLGGMYDETTFDGEITQNGAAKVGTQFIGWTATTVVDTFELFQRILDGTEVATAGLTQSLADTMLVQDAVLGSLGELLGEPVIGGVKNPARGRHPNPSQPVWAGGSLGGTMGFVYSAANPDITAAVLNVPGAAWAQFSWYSEIFNYVKLIMQGTNYPDPTEQLQGVVMSQLNFDAVDGANWQDAVGDHHALLVEQESIGDPVLPNIGNDMVAAASHAYQVGVVLNPIATCQDVPQAVNHNGMTQFKVPKNVIDDLQIHGFAAGSTPAGIAAQQQIVAFIASVWADAPVISVPPECHANTPTNSCDFTNDVGD